MSKFQAVGASSKCILKQVQRSLKSAELMEDLAKADIKTVKTFIDNNITAERLLVDVLHPKKDNKQDSKNAKESINSGEKSRKQPVKK